jgi:hypothetical protein
MAAISKKDYVADLHVLHAFMRAVKGAVLAQIGGFVLSAGYDAVRS